MKRLRYVRFSDTIPERDDSNLYFDLEKLARDAKEGISWSLLYGVMERNKFLK